jgi:exopolysaccharide biosynthesis protein
MFRMFSKRMLPIYIGVLFISFAGCEREDMFIPESPLFSSQPYASSITKKVVDKVNLVKRVVADTLTELAPGVKQTTINYLDYSGKAMRLFIIEADLNNPQVSLKAATPNNSNIYAKQTVADIARANDVTGSRVIAAVNGDFFNTTTAEPQSILYRNGVAVKSISKMCALCTAVSIDVSGTPSIILKDRPVDSTKIKEAIGGYHLLIKDSARVSQGDPSIDPRTAIGISSNKTVYIVVVDGRKADYSNGMSFAQLSDVFVALGVRDAINLDGGGSTTLAVREGSGFNIKNNPSDGVQRAVSNALTIVTK